MKKLLIIPALFLIGCQYTEEVNPEASTYWGCWTEATGKENVYDIYLEPGNITIGHNCGLDTVASLDIVFFRNDTLILDNGDYEFWCYLEGDTLIYSAYVSNPQLEKFLRF